MVDRHWVPQLNRQFRFQWEEAQSAYVLLYPEGMVTLNGPAGEILSRCDGKKSVDDIIGELEAAFPDAEGIAADICAFLTEAVSNGWLDPHE